jgi:hypothetical protein
VPIFLLVDGEAVSGDAHFTCWTLIIMLVFFGFEVSAHGGWLDFSTEHITFFYAEPALTEAMNDDSMGVEMWPFVILFPKIGVTGDEIPGNISSGQSLLFVVRVHAAKRL